MILLGLSFISLFATLLWWFFPKEKKPKWIPILKILPEKPQILHLRLTKPPFFLFLCFLTLMSIWLFFGWKSEQKNQNLNLKGDSVFIFADFSPSVSGMVDIDTWKSQIFDVWNKLEGKKRTLKTSHSEDVFEGTSAELKTYLDSLNWHRFGTLLSESFKGEIHDQVIILSDLDDFSWDIKSQSFLLILPKSFDDFSKDNIYLSDVEIDSQSKINQWNVSITATKIFNQKDRSGILYVKDDQNQILGQWEWSIPPKKNTIRLPITLDHKSEFLVWDIKTTSEDAILEDNIFRTYGYQKNQEKSVLLVSPSQGEQLLDDPRYELRMLFETIGFDVTESEHIPVSGFPEKLMVWFFSPGMNASELDFRIPPEKTLWIMPQVSQLPKIFEMMCRYTQSLRQEESEFCSSLMGEEEFSGWIKSLKNEVFPLGEISIWNIPKKSLLVFGFPLVPHMASRRMLSYGRAPIFLDEILKWQKGYSPFQEKNKTLWPRILSAKNNKNSILSNVPKGESFRKKTQAENIPPLFSAFSNGKNASDKDDVPTYIKIGLSIVIFVMILESVYGVGLGLGLWLIIFIFCLCVIKPQELIGSQSGLSQIIMDDVPKNKTFQNITQMINDRTSIKIKPDFKSSGLNNLEHTGFYWIRNSVSMEMAQKITPWIKRGGFLVVEDRQIIDVSKNLFLSDKKQPLIWSDIPLHHEFLKSFFLLNSLPICFEGESWMGAFYDERLVMLIPPKGFIFSLSDTFEPSECPKSDQKINFKTFVNLFMMVLSTDYKNDQIHVKELLKRVREK